MTAPVGDNDTDTIPDTVDESGYSGVGALLRASRERLGEDLPDVARMLRIRYPYMEAIESGRFDKLPGATYTAGFIRAYSDHLGLDSEEIIRRYKTESADDGSKPDLSFPTPVPETGIPGGAFVFIGLVVCALAYTGWYLSTTEDDFFAGIVSPIPDRLSGLIDGDKKSPAVTAEQSEPDASATPESPGSAPVEATVKKQVDDAVTAAENTAEGADVVEQAEQSADAAESTAQDIAAASTADSTGEEIVSVADTTDSAATQITSQATAQVVDTLVQPAESPVDSTTTAVSTTASENENTVAASSIEPVVVAPTAAESAATPEPTVEPVPEPATEPVTAAPESQPEPQSAAQPAPQGTPETPISETVSVTTPEPASEQEPVPAPSATTNSTDTGTSESEETPTPRVVSEPAQSEPQVAEQAAPAPAETPEPTPATEPEPEAEIAAVAPTVSEEDAAAAGGETAETDQAVETASASASAEPRIIINAIGDSWIQVRDDINAEMLVTRLLQAGQSYEVPNRSGLVLLTGNAGALSIVVDGTEAPSIGGPGVVRRGVALDPEKLRAGTAVSQ